MKVKNTHRSGSAIRDRLFSILGNSSRRDNVLEIGVVLAEGPTNDMSVNQYVVENLKKLRGKEFGKHVIDVHFKQPHSTHDRVEGALHQLAKRCELVVGIGTFMRTPFQQFVTSGASRREGLQLAVVDMFDDVSHIHGITFDETRLAHRAGRISAIVAQARRQPVYPLRFSFIGGARIPVVQAWAQGFKSGVKEVVHDAEVHVDYLGSAASSFNDPMAAYHMTRYCLDYLDVSVIMQACGASCVGVFRALSEGTKNNRGERPALICCDYPRWDRKEFYGVEVLLSVTRDIELHILREANVDADQLHEERDLVKRFPGEEGAYHFGKEFTTLKTEQKEVINNEFG